MPLVVADRVRETTTTTGTGTVTLAGAVTGYQSFSAIGNGNTTYYTINAGSQFEVGIGTYLGAGPTLSRDTVLESSNAGALVNFSAGTKDVFVTYPAEKSISDGYGLLPVANGGTGQSSYTDGQLLIGNTTGNTLTKTTLTAGTNVTITNGSGSITINAADQYVGTVTSVGGTGTVNGITLTGTVTTSGSLTLGGTLSGVSLTSQVTGTLPVGNGGTGATTLTANGVLYGSGTSAIAATAVGTTGQVLVGNTGAAPSWSTLSGIGVTSFSAGTTGLTPSSATTGVVTLAGTLNVANGGTGATTLSSGYLLKGNGVSPTSASVVYDDGTNVSIGTTVARGNLSIGTIAGTATTLAIHLGYTPIDFYGFRVTNISNAASVYAGSFSIQRGTGSAWSDALSISNAGNTTANVDMRAPIFYDSDNTAFYADMAGTSEFNTLQTRGGSGVRAFAAGSASISSQLYFADAGNTRAWNWQLDESNNAALWNYDGSSWTKRFTFTSASNFTVGGAVTANQIYAQIFYDSQNGAYYVDPASTSVLNVLNLPSGSAAINTTTPGTGAYQLNFTAQATPDNAQAITWGWSTSGAQAGIYVQSSGSYGTKMYLATTDSFATGAKTAMSIDHLGVVTTTRNYLQAAASVRAPIFYDSDNTAYYFDGAGTTALNINGQIQFAPNTAQISGNDTSTYGSIAIRGVRGGWYGIHIQGGGNVPHLMFTAANGGIYFEGTGRWASYYNHSDNCWGFGTSATSSAYNIYCPTGVYSGGRVDGTIFYDSNNTAYYVDPASGSVLGGQVSFAGGSTVASNGDVYARRSSGTTGVYYFADGGSKYLYWDGGSYIFGSAGYVQNDVSMRAPIFYDSNNTGFFIDAASSSSLVTLLAQNLGVYDSGVANDPYGKIAVTRAADANNYSYYGLTRSGQLGAGFGIDTANRFWWGSATAGYAGAASAIGMTMSMGGTLSVAADVRAPIFYDSNDTTYYINPNASSAVKGAIVIGPNNSYTQYIRFGGEGQASDMATVCTTNGNLHADSKTGFHIYLNYASNGNIYLNNGGGYTEGATSIRAPIFYDSNDTGYYVNPNSTSILSQLEIAGASNKYLYINPGVGYEAMVRYNGGTGPGWYVGKRTTTQLVDTASFHFYSESAGATVGGIDVSGNMLASGSMRAPIFYDTTDTAYYWNFAGGSTSNIYTFIVGLAYYQCNFGSGVYSGSVTSPPLQVFSNDGGTAMMSFHRGGAYAVNFGLDPDNVLRIGGWSASSNRLQMDMSGNLTMAGNVTAYSDARLKKDVTTIEGALDLVGKMRGVTYTRIDTDKAGVGVIAQEMLEVMPEVVQQGVGDDDTLSVAYGNLVGVLIEAIKELTARVAELEGK